jgi:hypothetical protein
MKGGQCAARTRADLVRSEIWAIVLQNCCSVR